MLWLLAAPCLMVALRAPAVGSERKSHHVQHGPCRYTFLLPEVEHCRPPGDFQVTNSLQRDSPVPAGAPSAEQSWQNKKLEALESVTENNTQWLQKLENYIQENVRSEMQEMQRNAIHTQTAAMLQIGTNLLSQSAEQTRKLTDVETQVLNQTTRLEVQLQENSLSTLNLEKQILLQTQEISRLNDKNSLLEQRIMAMEDRHTQELKALGAEKLQLQELLVRQGRLASMLEAKLGSPAQKKRLLDLITHCNEIPIQPKEETQSFQDCAEIFKSGTTESGVYSLNLANSTKTVKVFCDMETHGGGWTVLQRRHDGSVDFHRNWADYKVGFGEPSGEYWMGNDFIHLLTTGQDYILQVQLRDVEGNEAYSQYDHFYIDGEENNYRLHVRGFSGTAGRTSSLAHSGIPFSTKDRDNDRCTCNCSQMASGGWWFEACGPSNLNGIYYSGKSSILRLNGIKWYYWKGLSLKITTTTMMVRFPEDACAD
ncbi:angiopoietin-2b isoform X1 [Scleropages formosus]|uniref:Angiopoietin 2b n=1 Tax=Scleropages formosus TaxID=113540 RepID=A0A8C9RBZ4_SCLFO|nr:angiopoietin-2-like isoform X1 [Scleropages formosus]